MADGNDCQCLNSYQLLLALNIGDSQLVNRTDIILSINNINDVVPNSVLFLFRYGAGPFTAYDTGGSALVTL